jgi:hypothetical protein
MTLVALALVASLTSTVDPLGGTKAAPLVVPLEGSTKGFQATRTTRWLRFKAPDCRWITLSGEFDRGDANTVVLPDVETSLVLGTAGDAYEQPVVFESNNSAVDVGISVRRYTHVALTWTAAPCQTPKPKASTQALIEALVAWPERPSAKALRDKLEAAGVRFDGDDASDTGVVIDGVTIIVQVDEKPLQVTLKADEPPGDDGYERVAAVLESVIGGVGRASLLYRTGAERAWFAQGTHAHANLSVREIGYEADPTELVLTYHRKGGAR